MKRLLIITLFLMACGLVISNSVWPIPPFPPKTGAGTGDMTKATYDANSNNVVDTASALASDPSDCAAGQLATGIDASGNLTCSATPSLTALTLIGANSLGLGTAGSAVGSLNFKNATSGYITVQPITGALGTPTLVLGTTYTDGKWCSYATATGLTCNENAPSGSGTVDVSGTPSNHYWAGWTDADTLKGFSITASKPVCSDANGDPAVCAGTEGVWQPADADLTTYAGITPSADIITLLGSANNATALTNLGSWGVSGSITDEQLVCSETTGGTNLLKSCGAKTTYTEPAANTLLMATGTGTTGGSGLIKGTMTNGYLCTYTTTGTLLDCNTDPDSIGGTGDFLADGTVAMTGAPVPNAANTIALGSATAEWADIYLGDGAIIYGQNDQSNTITSSATGWSFAKPITIADVSNDNYIKITNNSDGRAPTASVYEIYPDAGVWKVNQNGTESSVPIGPTAGQVTFSGPTQARTVTLPDAAVTIPANPIGGTLGATTNVIPKASGTGTATLQASGITEDGTSASFGALNLVTTGSIQAGIKISSDANGMSSSEMTAVGLYGTMFFATGAGTWALPPAATGMSFCVYSTGANAIVINPDNSDVITLNGTALSAGDSITSASGAGDFICLVAADATNWYTLSRSGTWTDTN